MERKIKNNKGFTLLELIIVMTIIGFIAFLVPPLMSSTIENMEFKTAAKQMSNTIRFAKNLSINTRVPVTFKIDNKSNNYWITAKDIKKFSKHTLKKLEKKINVNRKISITARKDFKSKDSFLSGRFANILYETDDKKDSDQNPKNNNGSFSISFQPNGNSSGGLIELRQKHKDDEELENSYFTIRTSLFSGRVILTEHRP